MACEDDLDIVHKEQENRNEASHERDVAFEAMRDADADLGSARAERADCGSDHPLGEMIGFCSDEQDALDAAQGDYDSAHADYDAANEALTEAEGWLDLAEEMYCECLRDAAQGPSPDAIDIA